MQNLPRAITSASAGSSSKLRHIPGFCLACQSAPVPNIDLNTDSSPGWKGEPHRHHNGSMATLKQSEGIVGVIGLVHIVGTDSHRICAMQFCL